MRQYHAAAAFNHEVDPFGDATEPAASAVGSRGIDGARLAA
ncbi:hypothetical protein [Candidatus Laterigemmans baculatus]|nr:hypothetical protein [Candidatus Laterigemmans baculatus]